MWAYSHKNRKQIAIFGINLSLRENLGGPQKKLNIGAQLQTSLYAGKCLQFGCSSPKATKLKIIKATYRRVQNLRIPYKLCKRVTLRGKFMAKVRNFDSFEGCIPTFLPL